MFDHTKMDATQEFEYGDECCVDPRGHSEYNDMMIILAYVWSETKQKSIEV